MSEAVTIRSWPHRGNGPGRVERLAVGAVGDRLAEYRRRGRCAEVEADDGHLVGEVAPHPDTGRLVWWAEQ